MAQMFPRMLDEGANPDERIVFDELAKLPDDWMVFHNIWEFYDEDDVYDPKRRQTKRLYNNFEADFVVLVPGLGMTVIEVKGHHHLRIKDGVWQYIPHGDREWRDFERAKLSPLHQAYLAASKLHMDMRRRGVHLPDRMESTCLAVLTNCAPPENTEPCTQDRFDASTTWEGRNKIPAGRDDVRKRYIYGLGELRTILQEKIEGAFVYGNDNLMPHHMASIRADLCANYRFRRDRTSYEHELQHAGAAVGAVLEMLQDSTAHMRIDGCAGSGKTVMLCREVHRLYGKAKREGRRLRILVLCYNEWLFENNFRHEFEGMEDMVEAATFLTFCKNILIPRNVPTGPYGELLPEGAAFLIRHLQKEEGYDYVFIDEAQDFTDSQLGVDWWQVIMQLPKPGVPGVQPQGRITAFCDKNQILYGTKDCVPSFPIRLTLNRNLRNSRQVAAYSSGLLPEAERPEALSLSGEEIHLLPACDTVEGRRDAVLKCVGDILKGEAAMPVSPEDIVVLSPYTKEGRSVLPALKGMLPEGVRACSIKKFKGLESLYVILADIPTPGCKGFSTNDFYVACTRAKFGLYIIPTPEGSPAATRLLPQS